MDNNLSRLRTLIDMILKEDNELHKKRMWSLINLLAKNELGQLTDKDVPVLLNEMHELNLEQYIKIQAESFYKEFPLTDIKEELINDFIKMEHCRRRDDFQGFSMALYQQLENVINFLIDNFNYLDTIKKNFILPAITIKFGPEKGTKRGELLYMYIISPPFVNYEEKSHGEIEEEKKAYYAKAKEDFLKKEKKSLSYYEKARIVMYCVYFAENLYSKEIWSEVYNMIRDTHNARNTNHRGAALSMDQAKAAKRINENRYFNYLIFHGFLADFIQTIIINLKTKSV